MPESNDKLLSWGDIKSLFINEKRTVRHMWAGLYQKFIENVILNRIMLIIKQEPIEYHMCFHWINFNQFQCKFK